MWAETFQVRGRYSSTYEFFSGTAYQVDFKFNDFDHDYDFDANVPRTVQWSIGQFTTTGFSTGPQRTKRVEQLLSVGNASSQTVAYDLTLTALNNSEFKVDWILDSPTPLTFNTSQGTVKVNGFRRTQADVSQTGTFNYSATFELQALGIPEPASVALLLAGTLAALFGRGRKVARRAAGGRA